MVATSNRPVACPVEGCEGHFSHVGKELHMAGTGVKPR